MPRHIPHILQPVTVSSAMQVSSIRRDVHLLLLYLHLKWSFVEKREYFQLKVEQWSPCSWGLSSEAFSSCFCNQRRNERLFRLLARGTADRLIDSRVGGVTYKQTLSGNGGLKSKWQIPAWCKRKWELTTLCLDRLACRYIFKMFKPCTFAQRTSVS